MRRGNVRNVLGLTFIVGLTLAICAVLIAYGRETISAKDLRVLLVLVLTTYGIHIGVILGGYFGSGKSVPSGNAGFAGGLAIVLAILWNLLVLTRLGLFVLAVFDPTRTDDVSDLSTYIENVAIASSFLVTGALSFFFARRAA